MNNWGTHREVEKLPRTKTERHLKLKDEADVLILRLARMVEALSMIEYRETSLRTCLLSAHDLLIKLTAELRVSK